MSAPGTDAPDGHPVAPHPLEEGEVVVAQSVPLPEPAHLLEGTGALVLEGLRQDEPGHDPDAGVLERAPEPREPARRRTGVIVGERDELR
jgi:hypothetical protein